MTLHVLHAGDGYTYLTDQVATGDVQRTGRRAADPWTNYYTGAGNPAGRWVGSACADLGVTGEVDEEQMLALYGEGLHPDANRMIADRIRENMTVADAIADVRLGRKFAAYDKNNPLSVEIRAAYDRFAEANNRRPTVAERRQIKEDTAAALLALTDPDREWSKGEIRKYIVDQLGDVKQAVAGFDCVFTPVKSVSLMWALGDHETRMLVEQAHEEAWREALAYGESEAAFTRVGAAGIAQVDTSGFVATAFVHRDSRAGDPNLHTHVAISNRVLAADGKWRTIDSRQMHRVAVSMSERYNAAVEDAMTRLLGVRWTERSKGPSKRPVREIAGVPEALIKGFSRRRSDIESGYDRLIADYVRDHGHTPPRSVQYKLAQQACLEGRPEKKELRRLDEQLAEWMQRAERLLPGQDVTAVMLAASRQTGTLRSPDEVDLDQAAADVLDVVSTHRSTWTVYHVRAQADRIARGIAFPNARDRRDMVEAITRRALTSSESVLLDLDVYPSPRLLQRRTTESVFRRRGAERYTSRAILQAEDRLVQAAQTMRGPAAPARVIDTAITQLERHTWHRKKTLNAGQRALVHHFVGSGASLAVGIGPPGTGKSTAMRAVRAAWETTGGRVIGLAPSAAAAKVLGDELGVQADTMHALLTAYEHGLDVDVREGDMLLVDESGMAGTRLLDEILTLAEEYGAVVRLVGDHRQLTAVEAGGALRLVFHESGGAELTEVRRFKDPQEAAALLKFRVGDTGAVKWYEDNDRLRTGVRSAVLDQLYSDWQADISDGKASIMMSDTNDVVRQLSARAQLDRRIAGLAESDGVELHDGNTAGVGDIVVTRKNQRRAIMLSARDFVKNGDLWEVEHRHANGRLSLRHLRHGGKITLSAAYVAEYVELGYASTIHRGQGLTVELGRSHLSPATTREAGLVALSRGTDANYAYLETDEVLAADEPETLPGDTFYRHRNRTEAGEALAGVINHEGAEPSATEELREALEAPYRLDALIPQHEHGVEVHRGPEADDESEQWVRDAMPDHAQDMLTDPAWPALAAVLHQAAAAGLDPAELLAEAAEARELDTADSVAQVMHWRVADLVPLPDDTDPARPAGLPGWVSTPPETLFPAYGELPEDDRPDRDDPPPEHAVLGGPSERQLMLPTVTDPYADAVEHGGPGPNQMLLLAAEEPRPPASGQPEQAALFPVSGQAAAAEPVTEHPLLGGPSERQLMLPTVTDPYADPVEHGGPGPNQMLLFDAARPHPAVEEDPADSSQLALFAASEPHRQADLLELGGWLADQAVRIVDRIRALADRASGPPPDWTADLGPLPEELLDREDWLDRAGQVAAYRERYRIPDSDRHLLGPANVRGEQRRARQWVLQYLYGGPRREPVTVGGRGPRPTRRRAEASPARNFWGNLRGACSGWLQHQAAEWVRAAMPDQAEAVLADPAWSALAARLHDVEQNGLDAASTLADAAAARELGTADSIAQVMHYRLADAAAPASSADAVMPTASPLTDGARAFRDRLAEAGRRRIEEAAADLAAPDNTPASTPAEPATPAEAPPQPERPTPVEATAPDFWSQLADASTAFLDQAEPDPEPEAQPEAREHTTEPSQPRSASLRDRLAALRTRLDRPAHTEAEHEPGLDAGDADQAMLDEEAERRRRQQELADEHYHQQDYGRDEGIDRE